jgi:CPA2 family monovalent cation:H+ antiporter-2
MNSLIITAAAQIADSASQLNVEALITDLAFILLLGAGVTLLFKWIKQPVVLGYIVAGFLASPNFEPLPSVANEATIEFWAQIGIVVLLFSLGLEFSFKKLVNTGGSAVVTALIIVVGMMATGFAIGHLLGFSTINSLFLGGMLSMSSTTIIIKAFNDLGIKQKKFASLVFAVLIVEDLFAVVMMVVLSSIALNNSVEGSELLMSISKLVFFLIIWFVVGVFVLPSLLNSTRRFLNNETLLIVSMGLCLGMAVFSVACGFSLALGAFVMGSILAGTSYAERIEKVTMPVKDLFGAVFFISVGMMVEPDILVNYWWPILLLSVVVVVGMNVFGTFGMLVTGQPLKIAIESGFSLTQIGEFAFIIASLGMSLGVLNPTIYPIVVAVSVITTFTTPYFIKLADPFYLFVERHLPARLHFLIERYSTKADAAAGNASVWRAMVRRYLWRIALYSIILIAITLVSYNFLMPWLQTILPNAYRLVGAVVTLGAMSPFLLALSMPTTKNIEVAGQLPDSLKVPRIAMRIVRVIIVLAFIVNVLSTIFSLTVGFAIGIAIVLFISLYLSKRLRKHLRHIEQTFFNNLNERELRRSGKNNSLVSDMHLAYIRVGYDCPFVGERLRNTDIQSEYGINVVSITRGSTLITVPQGDARLFPGDIIGVIGSDEQIQRLLPIVEGSGEEISETAIPTDYAFTNVVLSASSPLIGKSLATADVRRNYSALIVAVERDGAFIDHIGNAIFKPADKLYLVARSTDLARLI